MPRVGNDNLGAQNRHFRRIWAYFSLRIPVRKLWGALEFLFFGVGQQETYQDQQKSQDWPDIPLDRPHFTIFLPDL